MDDTNLRLIELLEQNSRESNTELAKQLHVSEGTIRHRINSLLEKKIIRRFTIDTEKQMTAMIMVKTSPNVATDIVSKSIKEIGLTFILEIAGNFDILCGIKTKNLEETNDYVEKIRSIKGVVSTQTLPVLKKH